MRWTASNGCFYKKAAVVKGKCNQFWMPLSLWKPIGAKNMWRKSKEKEKKLLEKQKKLITFDYAYM